MTAMAVAGPMTADAFPAGATQAGHERGDAPTAPPPHGFERPAGASLGG